MLSFWAPAPTRSLKGLSPYQPSGQGLAGTAWQERSAPGDSPVAPESQVSQPEQTSEPTGRLTPDLAIASAELICGPAPMDPRSQALDLGGGRMELLEPWVRGLWWGPDVSLGPEA